MASDGGTSILASLTAQIMNEKTTASTRALTPVGPEVRLRPPTLPPTKAPFPNDMPQEVVEMQVKELDRVIVQLSEARDALATLANLAPVGSVVDLDAERKAKEVEADAAALERAAIQTEQDPVSAFDARLAALRADAEKAVFAIRPEDEAAMMGIAIEWTCPDHGKAVAKTSAKGAAFVGCPDCTKFQR